MNRRDALIAGLLAIILAILLLPFARQGIDPHHDGIMLKPALDVLAGQVLFRDTFTQYGALTTYLQTAALWFQPTLLSLRLQTVAAYAVTLFFLYAAWRMILPRSLAIVSCALFILFIPAYEKNWLDQYWMLLPWSSVYAMMFQSVVLYALFRVIRSEQPVAWGAILGAACAGVFWCRQPVGMITTGCVAVIWLALWWTNWAPASQSKRSILLGILAGFAVVNAVLLGGILISGALPEWWYQNFVWPRRWAMESVNVNWKAFTTVFVHPAAGAWLMVLGLAAGFPAMVKRFHATLSARSVALYYLCVASVLVWQHAWVGQVLALREGGWTVLFPLVVLVQSLISLARAFAPRGAPRSTEYYLVAALAVFALGSLLQYYPVPDSWHILWSVAPAFGLLAFVFWRWVGWPAPVVVMVLALALLPSLYAKTQTTRRALTRPMVTLAQPTVLRGMKVPPEQAHSLSGITATLDLILKHQPDIPSALIGNDALFLCFTQNHANPTPYYVTWVGLANNPEHEKLWNYFVLRVRPVMFLHKAQWDAVGDFYRRARYIPLLYLPEEALEIAIPQELADAMGLKAYGAAPGGEATKQTSKP